MNSRAARVGRFHSSGISTFGLGAAALLAASAHASPSLVGLGMLPGGVNTNAAAINADGSVVAGYGITNHGLDAFRWTDATGIVDLGQLPGGTSTYGRGVSADGDTVVGAAAVPNGLSLAWRWTSALGEVSIGTLPGGLLSQAWATSADGTTIVGYSSVPVPNSANYTDHAFRWRAGIGGGQPTMQDIGALIGSEFTYATGVNSDGSVVVGYGGSGTTIRPFRWTPAGGPQGTTTGLGTVPNGFNAYAKAVSSDGTTVIGNADVAGGNSHAWRWTAATGLVDLGLLPGTASAVALGVSANGKVVVGRSGSKPFIWTAQMGMVDFEAHMHSLGLLMTGWILGEADAISGDGLKITGTGLHNGVTEAWLATINPLPGAGASGCNIADLAGPGGSSTPDFQLTADDVIAFLQAFFAGDPLADVAGLGGTIGPDGQLSADDIVAFLGALFAGCP